MLVLKPTDNDVDITPLSPQIYPPGSQQLFSLLIPGPISDSIPVFRTHFGFPVYLYPKSEGGYIWKSLIPLHTSHTTINPRAKMPKIAQIEYFRVPPRWLFVKITDDAGNIGWGEASLEGHTQAVEGCLDAYIERYTGMDAE